MRLRRLLRLRRRGRRCAEQALCGRTGPLLLLNASGCLDALTAPDVARELDAFVTKTVTPEPRDGNPPVDNLRDFLAGHTQFRAEPLAVEKFSLIASFQTKAGSIYEDQADYPLLH